MVEEPLDLHVEASYEGSLHHSQHLSAEFVDGYLADLDLFSDLPF